MPLNLPNILTLGRIIVIIPLLIALHIGTKNALWVSALLFVAACLTDFLDGYLARLQKQQTAFGKFLDPIADKVLIAVVLLMLAAKGRIDDLTLIPAMVILSREILVSGLREFLGGQNITVPVSRLAKWKTTVQMMAIGLLLLGDVGPAFVVQYQIGEIGLWVAAALTAITGIQYFSSGFKALNTSPVPAH